MAKPTACQTPGAEFHIHVGKRLVSCVIDLPHELDLNDDELELLKNNLNNSIELVLSRYFQKTDSACNSISPSGNPCCFTVEYHKAQPHQAHMTVGHTEAWG